MLILAWFIAVLIGAFALAYVNASGILWSAGLAVALAIAWGAQVLPTWLVLLFAVVFVLLALPLNVPALRRKLVSDAVLSAFRKVLPPMSQTEREAIEAGTVWWDGELFSGKPDWMKLLAAPRPMLTPEEQHFLDHETEELCAMVTEWETTNVHRDLPPRGLAVHQGQGLLGNGHREGVRRPRLLRVCAFAGDDQAVDAFGNDLGDGDGAELARPGRADRALRHRRAEAPLPAAARERSRDPVLRAHESECRLGRGGDSRLRHRVLGRARRQARAGLARDLGQALHHARPRRDAAGPRLPRLRPRPSRRRQGRHRDHVCARPDVASRRRNRPPAHAAHCRVPERSRRGARTSSSRWTG